MKKPSKRFKAADVRMALRRHFAAPECAIVFEVAQSTGAGANRHLDAVAMELWPSRGLMLHGIEIKVQRADWRKEKKTPEKAEEVARYCDLFWIAAPVSIVPVAELPSAWGLIEVQENGDVRVRKAPMKTDSEPLGRAFLAALLRAAARGLDEDEIQAKVDHRIGELDAQYAERVESRAKSIAVATSAGTANWQALVEAVGEDPGHFYQDIALIAAITAVFKSGIHNSYSGLRQLEQALQQSAQRVGDALADLDAPEQPRAAGDTRRDGKRRLI